MIRVALYLILVGLIAYGVALLADRPGDVIVTWQGLRIETSLLVFGAAILAAVIILSLVFDLIRSIVRSPVVLARLLRNRRGVRAYEAISHGLIAVGAGAGAVSGALTDVGINDNFMKELAGGLTPGSSALFVLARKATPDKVLEEMRGTGGKILKSSLTHEDEAKLQAALSAATK